MFVRITWSLILILVDFKGTSFFSKTVFTCLIWRSWTCHKLIIEWWKTDRMLLCECTCCGLWSHLTSKTTLFRWNCTKNVLIAISFNVRRWFLQAQCCHFWILSNAIPSIVLLARNYSGHFIKIALHLCSIYLILKIKIICFLH